MRKRFAIFSASLVVAALASSAIAQPRRNGSAAARAASASAAQATTGVLAALPASDAVLVVDARRLLNEALPRAFNNNAQELARVNAEIEEFKAKTGIDAREFERIAVGTSFGASASGATTLDAVAVVQGRFNPGALIAGARTATKGRHREERHAGKTVHVFNLNERVKLLGLFNLRVTELAVTALDADTVALGKLARVRAAVDAAAGRGRLSPELAALATRNPSAVIGLGGNVPQSAFAGVEFPSEQLSRNANSIRQFYGSVGTSATGFQMQTVLRTATPADARSLGETITSLKQFAGPLINFRFPADRARLLRGVVDSTRVSAQGNEVQISLDLAQDEVAALIDAF